MAKLKLIAMKTMIQYKMDGELESTPHTMTLTKLKRKVKVDQLKIKKQLAKNSRQFQSVISLLEEEEMDKYFFNCFQNLYSTIKK